MSRRYPELKYKHRSDCEAYCRGEQSCDCGAIQGRHYPEGDRAIDPVCLSHGVPWSQNPPHWAGKCLVCQLCFKVLGGTDECNSLGDGSYEDVCIECARKEQEDHERLDRSGL